MIIYNQTKKYSFIYDSSRRFPSTNDRRVFGQLATLPLSIVPVQREDFLRPASSAWNADCKAFILACDNGPVGKVPPAVLNTTVNGLLTLK